VKRTNVTQWRKRGDLFQLPMRKSIKRGLTPDLLAVHSF
jgi:hypothetical protein